MNESSALASPAHALAAWIVPRGEANGDRILDAFLGFVRAQGLTLYPAQEEAMLEIAADNNVVLSTPTGSGKSLVATAMHFKAVCEGKRTFYTSPIKALASEKFFELCRLFGPDRVGMMTGDASINRDAPIICCTAEILASFALREGRVAPVDYAVLDEFHYYGDRDRGVAWEIPILTLENTRFLLMSATLGDTSALERQLTQLTGRDTVRVHSNVRPVPLDFEYRETPLHETIEALIAQGRQPIYLVHFTQRACAEEAQNLMSASLCTREEKLAIAEATREVRFDSPYGKDVQRFLRHGVGLHHAGLLPRYRRTVERLAQKGLLKVICGTDTLGVGVNVPIRTVLFTQLCKYDGQKTALLAARDFHQICGRAGRKGFDEQGSVVAQAPEHVIENLRLEQKAAGDSAKLRKLVRRKPPERGYVPWDRAVFERLQVRPPETLQSQFVVSHAMLLSLLASGVAERAGGYGRMLELLGASALDARAKSAQRVRACLLFRSLRAAGIIELRLRPSGHGCTVHMAEGLQRDFSLHQTLSLYLLETLELLDPEGEDYARDVLTLVESVIENPDVVLERQRDQARTERLAELKAQGMEYEARIAELDKVEYPKPLREFVYASFDAFAKRHPWLGRENIRPKSVARDLWERYATFGEYVREYGLQRSEGVLLRYLSDAYKTLRQSVPRAGWNDELYELVAFLRESIAEADSSLVDEWEALAQSESTAAPVADVAESHERRRYVNAQARRAKLRARLGLVVKALAARDYDRVAHVLATAAGSLPVERIEVTMGEFEREHGPVQFDAEARSARHVAISEHDEMRWTVRQTLVDAEGYNDWCAVFETDTVATESDGASLRLVSIGPLASERGA